jgi:excisionase family DNA binding protein
MVEIDLPNMSLRPKDVAAKYDVSLATVYRWVRLGRLPALRLGPRVLRFSEIELASWELNHQSKRKRFFSPL